MAASAEFEAVVVPHYGQVEGLCQRMLGRTRAQDAAQETFIRALQSFPTLRDRGLAKSWVLTIAMRQCLDTLRKREHLSVEEEPAAPGSDLDAGLLGTQILRAVQPRSRSLLVLRHWLELSYAEIAEVLEMPPNQVGVLLQRARQEALRYATERGMLDAVR